MSSAHKRQMHPRNIFRTPPDYTDLAIKYTNFRQVCKLELNGKVTVDYKNESALRALVQMLLQEYFQLHVDFAPGSLIPTLPLRLNYILWVEDLIATLDLPTPEVAGIDIGCGSACIYSLLAAKKNNWHMFALESSATNLGFARQNVERNQMQHLIHIHAQRENSVIFGDFFKAGGDNIQPSTFHFCLCNPPFFDSSLSNPFGSTTRNAERRAPPHNCHTGQAEELCCEGGEVQFVQRIIEESQLHKQRVCIYTSMLGHKSSLGKILEALQNRGISRVSTTEFCQGNTTRWGVAWSFTKDFTLKA